MYVTCFLVHYVGWIDITEQSCAQKLVFAKVTEVEGSIVAMHSFVICDGLHWYSCVENKKLSPSDKVLTAMPQIISSVICVQEVINFLVLCCSNEGETFQPVIAARKGSFLSATGKYMKLPSTLNMVTCIYVISSRYTECIL